MSCGNVWITKDWDKLTTSRSHLGCTVSSYYIRIQTMLPSPSNLETLRNLVDVNICNISPNTSDGNTVIGISTKQSLTIGAPSQAEAVIVLLSLSLRGLQFLYNTLALQIPDHDATACGSTEPVSCGWEAQSVDLIFGFEGVEMFRVVQVPEHGSSVLSSWGTERTIGGDGDYVDVSSVSVVVSAELAFAQFPDLDHKSALSMKNYNVFRV